MTDQNHPVISIFLALLVIQTMIVTAFADTIPFVSDSDRQSCESDIVFLSSADLSQMIHSDSPSFHTASIVDGDGKVWDGVLLRELITGIEGERTLQTISPEENFNQFRSAGLYAVITGSDGKERILQAGEINSSRNYLLADTLDGYPLSRDNDAYPFILVGKGIQDDEYIRGVSEIGVLVKEQSNQTEYKGP